MPGWHDIKNFDSLTEIVNDEPGIRRSQDYFHSLIKAEIDKGIPSHRIILGGFSQGGAISLYSGLTFPSPLAGIVGLSSYLLHHTTFTSRLPSPCPNLDTPIFMGHGEIDPLVQYTWGKETADKLKEAGCKKLDFRTYKGLAHSADPKEIDDLEKWLAERVPDIGGG